MLTIFQKSVRLGGGRLTAVLVCGTCLAGCSVLSFPSQTHPDCSWSTSPPAHAARLCDQTFHTLRSLVQASATGKNRVIYQLVADTAIAHRIITYGRDQRKQGLQWMHVVPSIAMGTVPGGRIGAGFYIVGRSKAGKISAPQTLYLRVRDGRVIVVGDQPAQEW